MWQKALNSVIFRKLKVSAQVLIDTFIEKSGGMDNLNSRHLFSNLEKSLWCAVLLFTPKMNYSCFLNKTCHLHNFMPDLTPSQASMLSRGRGKICLTDIKEKVELIRNIELEGRLLVNTENKWQALEALPLLSLDQMSTFLTNAIADNLKPSPFFLYKNHLKHQLMLYKGEHLEVETVFRLQQTIIDFKMILVIKNTIPHCGVNLKIRDFRGGRIKTAEIFLADCLQVKWLVVQPYTR